MLGQALAANYGREARDLRTEALGKGVEGARAALETFYFAFNNRSLEALAAVWAPDPSVSLANPLGGILTGAEEISALYRRIFEGTARVWVEYHDIVEFASGDAVLFAGRERGEFRTDRETVPLAIRTSRYFRRRDSAGWRQVHHHGSIDDAALLARYQKAVRG
ncbi:MAG: nuclear transport factor 2 family protein [Thermodesulfobacteriota bacterium]